MLNEIQKRDEDEGRNGPHLMSRVREVMEDRRLLIKAITDLAREAASANGDAVAPVLVEDGIGAIRRAMMARGSYPVPEGWRLLPTTPTGTMLDAFFSGFRNRGTGMRNPTLHEAVGNGYRAMLEATSPGPAVTRPPR